MTKFDSNKILSDTLLSATRSGFFVLRGIILIPIITKTAGAEIYGLWSTALALIGVLTTVGGLHLYGALIRYGQQDSDVKNIASEIYILVFFTTMVFGSIFLYINTIFELNIVEENRITGFNFLVILVLISIMNNGYIVLRNASRAAGKVKMYEVIRIIEGVLEALILGVVFYFVGEILAGLFALLSIFLLLNILLGFRFLAGFNLPSMQSLKRYLGYGAPMFPREVASSLIQHADKVLILYFLSPTAVGIYTVVYSVMKLLRTMASSVNSTLYPTVSTLWDNGDHDSLIYLYDQINRWIILLGLPAVSGLVFVADSVIRLLSTSEIASTGIEIVPILAIGFAISGYSKPLVYILTAAEETVKLGGINTLGALVNIGLNILLIPRMGLSGAAFATATTQILIAGYIAYHAHRRVKFSLPLQPLGISLIGTATMIAVLVIAPVPPVAIIEVIIYPILGLLLYLLLLVLLGGTSRSELTNVIRTIRS